MSKYEMLYLLNNELTDEAKASEVEKFESVVKTTGGTLVSTDKWGTKKLCYPIHFKNEAYYVLMTFEGEKETVNELTRISGIDSDVMRTLITKLN